MENSEIQSSQVASAVEDRPRRDGYHPTEVEQIAKARKCGRKTVAEEFREEYFYGRCNDKKICILPNDDYVSWPADSSGITWVGVHGSDSICVVTKAVDLDLSRVHGFLMFQRIGEVRRRFRRAVISEIEDLVEFQESEYFDDSEDSEDSEDPKDLAMCGKSIQLPFAVVSLVPPNHKVHKASSGEYKESRIVELLLERLAKMENGEQTSSDDDSEKDDEDAFIKYSQRSSFRRRGQVNDCFNDKKNIRSLKKEMERDTSITINEAVQESMDEYDEETAIKFLQEKVDTNEDFTVVGTIKTAIAAFQILFQKKFKATEIEVSVMDPNYFVFVTEAHYKDVYVKHLERSDIEKYLAAMTEQGSGGSPMSSDGGGSGSGGSNGGCSSSGGSPMSSDDSD